MNVTSKLLPAITQPLPVRREEKLSAMDLAMPAKSQVDSTPIKHIPSELREKILSMRTFAIIDMDFMRWETQKFTQSLDSFNPELAGKNFGYTLGDDSKLKILDPEGSLSARESEWLTEAVNSNDKLLRCIKSMSQRIFKLAEAYQTASSEPRRLNASDANSLTDWSNIDTIDFWKKFDQWAGVGCQSLGTQQMYGPTIIDTNP